MTIAHRSGSQKPVPLEAPPPVQVAVGLHGEVPSILLVRPAEKNVFMKLTPIVVCLITGTYNVDGVNISFSPPSCLGTGPHHCFSQQ